MIQSATILPQLPPSYDFRHSMTGFNGKGRSADNLATFNGQNDSRAEAINIMNLARKAPIKLFIETSDESFEESLMAGGYGRYRTREWVPQAQTMLCRSTGEVITPVIEKPISPAEVAPEAPPALTEKEVRKRKRLDAFRDRKGDSDPSPSKLYTIELEGKGRVLSDIPNTPHKPADFSVPRRLNTSATSHRKRRKEDAPPSPEFPMPDWPDSEFPWKLRTEERAKLAEEEKNEKLQWIEKFLDRDSDDEEPEPQNPVTTVDEEQEIPLTSNSHPETRTAGETTDHVLESSSRARSISFPSDPADARAALLAHADIIRALNRRSRSRHKISLRRQRDAQAAEREFRRYQKELKKRQQICLCQGTDDGREIISCSNCGVRYHLQCLGFSNRAEAIKDEEGWWCSACAPDSEEEGEQDQLEKEASFVSDNPDSFVPPRLRRTYVAFPQDGNAAEAPVASDASVSKDPD